MLHRDEITQKLGRISEEQLVVQKLVPLILVVQKLVPVGLVVLIFVPEFKQWYKKLVPDFLVNCVMEIVEI